MSMTDDSRDEQHGEEQGGDSAFDGEPTLQDGDRDPDERPGREGSPRYAYGTVEARLLLGARLTHAHVAVGMHSFTGGTLVPRV